jgi:hypothetical protein
LLLLCVGYEFLHHILNLIYGHWYFCLLLKLPRIQVIVTIIEIVRLESPLSINDARVLFYINIDVLITSFMSISVLPLEAGLTDPGGDWMRCKVGT